MTAATVRLEGGKVKLAIESQALRSLGRRIRTLLDRVDIENDTGKELLDLLDYVLGALYTLMYAWAIGYNDRPGALPPEQYRQESLLPRAADMNEGWLRIEGAWAAGLYFNSALARLDAAHDRAEDLAGIKRNKKKTRKTRPNARKGPSWCGFPQKHVCLGRVYKDVGKLKHTRLGTFSGREVSFADGVQALVELVTLLETIPATRRGVVS